MSGAHVTVNQAANPIPLGTLDVSRTDLWQSQVIHLVGVSSGGQTGPTWSILSWPFGSTRQQPASANTFDATFTPDVPGSYRVQYLVGDGIGANKKTFIFAVTRNSTGLVIDDGVREPAYSETIGDDTSASNDRGYARAYEIAMATEIPAVDNRTVLRTRMASRHKQVHMLGLVTKGDGLGGLFYWDAASVAADDDTNVLAPTGLATGRWVRTEAATVAGVTSVTAGAGLTGGGAGTPTLNVVAGNATIVVNADEIHVGVVGDANISDVAYSKVSGAPSPANSFNQGGNAFAALAVLGTTDAQDLKFITGNTQAFLVKRVASAVDYIKLTPAAAASPVELAPDGATTNVDLLLRSKGTGGVVVKPGTDGVSAFTVRQVGGTAIFSVDTTNNRVGLGTATPVATVHAVGTSLLFPGSLGNYPTGGSIGSAASTVDSYSALLIPQTTAAQTLTIPSPTTTTAGWFLYVTNNGSVSFTILGITVLAGSTLALMWNGMAWSTPQAVSGGGSVTLAGNVTGPSGTNVVEQISGTGGKVVINCDRVEWQKDAVVVLTQATQTTDVDVIPFVVEAGWAKQASGTKSGGVMYLTGGRSGALADPPLGEVQIWAEGGLWQICRFGITPFTAGTVVSDSSGNLSISAGSGGMLYDAQSFTATGAFNCTLPTGAYKTVRVRVWSGGGGGGSAHASGGGANGAGGAGGGCLVEKVFDFATLGGSGSVIAGNVGAGGAGGTAGGDGAVGGNSNFGAFLVAYGGGQGKGSVAGTGWGGSGGGAGGPGATGAGPVRGGGMASYSNTIAAGIRGTGYEGAGTSTNSNSPGACAIWGGGSGANAGGDNDTGQNGGQSLFGGGGGGGGGSTGQGSNNRAGGAGGLAGANTTAATDGGGGTAGGTTPTAGGAGASIAGQSGSGGGGGGGNKAASSTGSVGGAGGDRGGGGGASGACGSGGTPGAGGAGGRGQVDVICEG